MIFRGILGVAALCTAFSGCSSRPLIFETRTLTVEGPVVRVDIETANGRIHVHRETRANAVLTARLGAETQDRLSSAQVKADLVDGVLTIRVEWAQGRQTSEACGFDLVLPSCESLDAQTSNGTIEVAGFEGRAVLRTSNGAIRADGSWRELDAETSNGEIRVAGVVGPFRLTTSNGAIDVQLAPNFAGSVAAETSNGSVRYHGARGQFHQEGPQRGILTIGEGPRCEVRSSNGGINLR